MGRVAVLRYQYYTAGSVDRLELVGTRGAISLSVFGQEPIELATRHGVESFEAENPPHVHLPLVESIVAELSGAGRRRPSTGQSALQASRMMDRVLEGYYGGRDDAFWQSPEIWPGALVR